MRFILNKNKNILDGHDTLNSEIGKVSEDAQRCQMNIGLIARDEMGNIIADAATFGGCHFDSERRLKPLHSSGE